MAPRIAGRRLPFTGLDAYREWQRIQQFTAECRRLWPGAKITLFPDQEEEAPAKQNAAANQINDAKR